MRHQINKLKKGHSTKSERLFLEILKRKRIPFRTKVKIKNREVDFLIRKYAIDIDGHEQDGLKNHMLADNGYIPIHLDNKSVKKYGESILKTIWEI